MNGNIIDKLAIPEKELKKQEEDLAKKTSKTKNFVENEIAKMGDDSETQDKDLLFIREAIKELTSLTNIDTRTELNAKEILLFARLEIYANRFNLPVLKDFAKSIYHKKLSKGRGLRKEILQAISQIRQTEGENATSFPELLLGSKK
jgi:hypothetical protein